MQIICQHNIILVAFPFGIFYGQLMFTSRVIYVYCVQVTIGQGSNRLINTIPFCKGEACVLVEDTNYLDIKYIVTLFLYYL